MFPGLDPYFTDPALVYNISQLLGWDQDGLHHDTFDVCGVVMCVFHAAIRVAMTV